MCYPEIIDWFIEKLDPSEFKDKRVIEIGSKFVNGSVRPLIEKFCSPREYIGVDIEPGRYVDRIVSVYKLEETFGKESFDVVISTEMLEHVRDWRHAVNNMLSVLRPGGVLFVTTVSNGFLYHSFPYDFWRFEVEDLRRIFSECKIQCIEPARSTCGVFLKAVKPSSLSQAVQANLSDISLYSVVLGQRTKELPNVLAMPFKRRMVVRLLSSRLAPTFFPPVVIVRLNRVLMRSGS